MLDIKFVRETPDIVKQNIKNKFQDSKLELVDEVIELDQKNRDIKNELQSLQANRNKLSKQIGALMGQGKKEEAEEEDIVVPVKSSGVAGKVIGSICLVGGIALVVVAALMIVGII